MNHNNQSQGTTEGILITTSLDPATSEAFVGWQYKDRRDYVSIATAISRGKALLDACAVAEVEGRVAQTIAKNTQSPIKNVLALVRASRPANPCGDHGANPIYGCKTNRPLVEIAWYGETLVFDIEDARDHATILLEAAEAARTDQWLGAAFHSMGLNDELKERVLDNFRAFRASQEWSV
jgi:hypothetical protein